MFYLCVRAADDVADNIELGPTEKENILKKIEISTLKKLLIYIEELSIKVKNC